MTHVSQILLALSVDRVLADLHQLLEENVPDLRETSAGGLHKGIQNGVDVGLDVGPEELFRLGQHQSCTAAAAMHRGWKKKHIHSLVQLENKKHSK